LKTMVAPGRDTTFPSPGARITASDRTLDI
jgi:hypothetical protein